MFSMTVLFGSSPVPWTLLFKTQETFNEAVGRYDASPKTHTFEGSENLLITDDFGQTLSVKRSAIHGVMFEDLEQSKLAQVERGLHNARTQIAAEQAGRADPVISGFRPARAQGPAVISPNFNGMFRQ